MASEPTSGPAGGAVSDGGGPLAGDAWLAAFPDELAAQGRIMTGLVGRCKTWPLARSLLVGCSLGRGAADQLSDIDAALGVDAEFGPTSAGPVDAVEAAVVTALPELGTVIDVLRSRVAAGQQPVRRIFAQFADGTQLDLAVTSQAEIEMRLGRGGAPDFVTLYQAASPAGEPQPGPAVPPGGEPGAAYAVTGEQVREWAFLGWCALIDVDKYLRRGSQWEAHDRLHEARQHIWALWAAAHGAMYPWHGLSQVLDHDPGNFPPGIEATVAALDATDLRRAARASAGVLTEASAAAARRHPADLPSAMAAYVTKVLAGRDPARNAFGPAAAPADVRPE